MERFEREHLAWRRCNGRIILLDIAGDRYFRLTGQGEQDFRTEFGTEALEHWRQPDYLPRPSQWSPPTSTFQGQPDGRFQLGGVASAIWLQCRIERRLAALGLRRVLLDMCRLRQSPRRRGSGRESPDSVVLAHEQARLLRTAADRCLPGSIAVVTQLAARGIESQLVIGVRDRPFGAHCWAQLGSAVLNESLEEARRYTPLLVI